MQVTKTLLAKGIGSCILTVEEIYIVLADRSYHELQTSYSSRSLSYRDGVLVLIPGHFLISRPLRALPEKVIWNSSLICIIRNFVRDLARKFGIDGAKSISIYCNGMLNGSIQVRMLR